MKIGSLFSGIGGLELGLEWAGLGPVVWQCEIDPYCRGVLARHWPTAEIHDDVRTFHPEPGSVELICGGFPCQDLSPAGRKKGLSGERSGLWVEFARIIRETQPSWVVVENVNAARSKWLPRVRGDLHRLGYSSVPFRVRAADVGAWHERSRCFVIAYSHADGQLQPRGRQPDEWRRAFHASLAVTRNRWAGQTKPHLAESLHGIPARLADAYLLGNSVVPQCAEVVGRLVRQFS